MDINWQDSLKSLLDSRNLPEGDDVEIIKEDLPKQTGKLQIAIEKKGRGGKVATIISGFTIDSNELESLAATLKSKLGTGGSARGGEILIQGERREDVRKLLKSLGYKI